MAARSDVSRIIIEIPKEQHRKLKSRAAILGKTIKEVVLESLEATDECFQASHVPNKETKKSLKNIQEGKKLTEIESLDVLAKKLGL